MVSHGAPPDTPTVTESLTIEQFLQSGWAVYLKGIRPSEALQTKYSTWPVHMLITRIRGSILVETCVRI